MSDIEWRLISHIITETLSLLHDCWTPIMDIDFRVEKHDTNPMLMQIVPPNEVVILVCFELKMGQSSGMLNLCIPFPVIEPKIAHFSTIQTWFQTRRTSDPGLERNKLNDGIKSAPLETVVYIGKTSITLRQLLRMKPGDLLLTKKDIREPLLMTIGDRSKFWTFAGQNRHYKAVRIAQPAAIDDVL